MTIKAGGTFSLIAALLGTPSVAKSQQPAEKIAVVSLQAILAGTKEGQKASADLTAKYDPKRNEVRVRQDEIVQLQKQLNASGNVMSEDKKADLTREIQDKERKLQRDTQDAEEEMQEDQQRVLQSLGQRITAAISKYAKDNGYVLVLDTSNANTPVLYAADEFDISKEIIAICDKTPASPEPAK